MNRFTSALLRRENAVTSEGTDTGSIASPVTAALVALPWLRSRPTWPRLLSAALLIGLLIVIDVYAANFFRYHNIVNVLLQVSLLGLLTIGMTIVMIVGGIDLSLPANMAMSAVLGALYMKSHSDWIVGVVIMVTAATAIGFINGFAVARLKMIPFVVTLAMMTVLSGSSVWLTNSLSISQLPDSFVDFFELKLLFGIPVTILIVAAVAAIASVLIRSSVFGRRAYAVGINSRAAQIARIPVERVTLTCYVLSGLMAGLTAVLLTARLGSASANMGPDSMVLDIVSACVVGGVSIYGGSGRISGALFGALLITVLSNAMNLIGVSYYLSLIIKGVVIVTFTAVDRRVKGRP